MIYGDGIRLRALERSDLPLFVKWFNDPDVRAGLMLHLPMSLSEEEAWFDRMLKLPAAEHPLMIEIEQGNSWLSIGDCGFNEIDWRCRSALVGIVIGEKSLWNQGYGSRAMRLMLQHGFETLNLNRVALDVYSSNPRAIRSYEKVGFIHEGRKRQAMYKNGHFVDVLVMSVLRDEWEKVYGNR